MNRSQHLQLNISTPWLYVFKVIKDQELFPSNDLANPSQTTGDTSRLFSTESDTKESQASHPHYLCPRSHGTDSLCERHAMS